MSVDVRSRLMLRQLKADASVIQFCHDEVGGGERLPADRHPFHRREHAEGETGWRDRSDDCVQQKKHELDGLDIASSRTDSIHPAHQRNGSPD